jgi:hypothetical protein
MQLGQGSSKSPGSADHNRAIALDLSVLGSRVRAFRGSGAADRPGGMPSVGEGSHQQSMISLGASKAPGAT